MQSKSASGKRVLFLLERGDIYYVDLEPVVGSEQGGLRPALIIQNDVGNQYSPTTIIAPITTKLKKINYQHMSN